MLTKNIVFVWITLSIFMLKDATAADSKSKHRLASITTECKIAEKATESDLLGLKVAGGSKSTAVKCLSTCISEKMGIIVNHQLSAEGVMNLLRAAPNVNEKIVHGVNEIINECKTIRDSDRCEYGSKIMDCINDGGIKRGIKYLV